MWPSLLLISTLAVGWPPLVSTAPDKIICYHESWAYWRTGNGKFEISFIDTSLCTHINYAFLGINSDGTIHITESDRDFLTEYGILRNRVPKPKLLLSVGGWSEGSINFSKVVSNPSFERNFIDSSLRLLQQYKFDGVDIDWEYPGQRGGSPNDKRNFVTFLENIRREFNKYGYLLTAAVAATTSYYDVPGIVRSLDFLNVMTYDFAGSWNSVTGHHSSYSDTISSINAWKNAGAPYNKIALGIGFYGRTFTLRDPNNNGIGAPVIGGGSPGPYTGESGYLGYNEICEKLLWGGWVRKWANNLQVPYAHAGNQWVGYDDAVSIAIKSKFAVDNNLSGIMVWAVDLDDFRGLCGIRYPLLNAIKSTLKI